MEKHIGFKTFISAPAIDGANDGSFCFSLASISFSGAKQNGLLWEGGEKEGNFLEQNQLNRLQMVPFERTRVTHSLVYFIVEVNF